MLDMPDPDLAHMHLAAETLLSLKQCIDAAGLLLSLITDITKYSEYII